MPAILYSLFSIFPSFSFLSSFLPFLSQCLLTFVAIRSLEVTITVFVIVIVIPSTVHGKAPFYSAYCDRILLF